LKVRGTLEKIVPSSRSNMLTTGPSTLKMQVPRAEMCLPGNTGSLARGFWTGLLDSVSLCSTLWGQQQL
jgi:hypothetical protein